MPGMFFVGQVIVYGESYFPIPFLTTIVALSGLGNGLGRPMWGYLGDIYEPLCVLQVMSVVFACILMSYYYVATYESEMLFALWTVAIFLCTGGNFVLYMPVCVQTFGKTYAAANYGLIFFWLSIFEFINIVILAKLDIRFEQASIWLGICCLLGSVNLVYFSFRVKNGNIQEGNRALSL